MFIKLLETSPPHTWTKESFCSAVSVVASDSGEDEFL
jgi:hypothetical protein